MRKRNIKSVAHWVIMTVLLLFPVLMVGISAFANNEQSVTVTETTQYETNDVSSYNDFVYGNVYMFDVQVSPMNVDVSVYCISMKFSSNDYQYCIDDLNGNDDLYFVISASDFVYANDVNGYEYSVADGVFYFVFNHFDSDSQTVDEFVQSFNVRASTWLGEVTTGVDIHNASYKQEVNNWCNGFKNLPVNQWYGSLLNTIGVGQTDNSVMNVIYVYPLYVLWVYILDVIVDCFLVIINFGHNALHRLGGDNE